jgi:hypothetical protein
MRFAFFSFASLAAISSLLLLAGCQPESEPAAEPTAAPDAEATPVTFANSECPIMGGEPSPELTAQYKGQTIGFCCDGCPQKWAKLSAEEKAEKFAAVKADNPTASHADHEHGDHDHTDHEHGEDGETESGEAAGEAAEAAPEATAPEGSDA